MNLSQQVVVDRDSGLPSSQVHRLALDRHNRLWMAGPSGVCCYDGNRVRTIDRRQGLPCAGLRTVALGADDRVWIGTDLGPAWMQLDGEVLPPLPPSPAWTFGLVSAVGVGALAVWLGTAHGLVELLTDTGPVRLGRHLDVGYVRDLARVDGQRLVVAAAAPGLWALDDNGYRPLAVPPGLARVVVRRLARADDGGVVAVTDRQIWQLDRDGRALGHGLEVPGAADIDAVAVQGEQVWVAAGREVHGYLRDGSGALRPLHRSLASGKVNDLLIDGWGSVWVATDTAGVARISGLRDAVQRWPVDGAVYVIRPTADGGLQLGGDGFTAQLHDSPTGPTITQQLRLPGTVWDVLPDPSDGACWLATQTGLFRLAPDGVPEPWVAADGLLSAPCRALLWHRGQLWVGTLGGLVCLRDGVAEAVPGLDGLSLGYVYNLQLDPTGRLWVGTLGRGLWREGPDGLAPVRDALLPATANTYAVAMGPRPGQVLVLQDERVLLLEDGQAPRLVASAHPVAGWTALWLDEHRVAIGASDGLHVLDCRSGTTEQHVNPLFGTAAWEFTNNRALVQGRDGRLVCGLNGGLVVVDLAALARHCSPPLVALSQLRWQGAQARPEAGWTVVTPGKWSVEVDVHCAWLIDERQVRYRYRLVGFEPDWSPATAQATIRYSSLPPGDYQLQVQAESPLTGPGEAVTLLRLRVRAGPLQALLRRAAAAHDRLFGLHLRNRRLLQRHAELEAEVAARRKAEGLLQAHRAGLEQQVQLRTRQLLQARDEAERANRAKSEFLSRMSHELRTPLNAILGFAQLMGLDPAVAGQNRAFVDEMLAAGRHLLALVNDVLDLAQVEAGSVALVLEPVPLAPLVDECLSMVGPALRLRGLSTELRVAPGVQLLADRTRLRQVLINLLSNAVKYNQPGGWVRVEAGLGDRGQGLLSVVDGGPGIDPRRQAGLFQPFNRLGAEQGPEEGHGIGLSIVRLLVDRMGGEVGVHSQPGAGSRFWVSLPMVAAPRPPAEPVAPVAAPPDPGLQSATVLYVEDNPVNQRIVAHVIGRHPRLRLLLAATGQDGLALATHHRPDLILLDLHLPDQDGFAVLRALRADPRTADLPVVAVTALTMPSDLQRTEQAGCVDHVPKPIDIGRFDQMLARWLPGAPARADRPAEVTLACP